MESNKKDWKSVSPKTYFNERLFDASYSIKQNTAKVRLKVNATDFDILKYKDYKVLLEKNYNVLQLNLLDN